VAWVCTHTRADSAIRHGCEYTPMPHNRHFRSRPVLSASPAASLHVCRNGPADRSLPIFTDRVGVGMRFGRFTSSAACPRGMDREVRA